MYKRWKAGKFSLPDAIASLYKQYWKVFVILIPIAFLFFSRTGGDINPLAARYAITSKAAFISALISNFFGYSASFNSEWWFFSSYLCMLPLGCLMLTADKDNRSFLQDIFIVILINILMCNVFPNLKNTEIFSNINSNLFYGRFFLITGEASTFFEGIVFAKHDALAALKNRIKRAPFGKLLCISGAAVVFWSRMFIASGAPFDIIYITFFIAFTSALFNGFHALNTVFSYLGKHSTNMWLVHSFYCYYFLEATKIVYSTRSVWVDLLILAGMSLATSVLIELLYKRLGKTIRLT